MYEGLEITNEIPWSQQFSVKGGSKKKSITSLQV